MPARSLVLTVFVLVLGAVGSGSTQEGSLFLPDVRRDIVPPRDLPRTVRRARMARPSPGVLSSEHLLLNLFPDVVLHATRVARETPAGWDVWSGQLVGEPLSSVTFVRVGGALQGSIRAGNRAYSISPAPVDGYSEVRELDQSAQRPELPPLVPPLPSVVPDQSAGAGLLADDGSLVDVLVVYTADARAAAGGTDAAIQARIALGVIETNAAYANSGVLQRLRLVGAELVGYHESGDVDLDLRRLTERTDGQIDDVHARRDAVGADLVQLVVGPASSNACGVAWLMQVVSPSFAPFGFSVSEYDCISPNYTFGHELAHNMGSAHAPEDANPPPAFPYSYGYKDPAERFRTVMAYDCHAGCPRVLHFSNPAVDYDGAPTGTSGRQDNARSLNATASTVSNFRTAVDPTIALGAPEQFGATATGTTVTFSWLPPDTGTADRYVIEVGTEEGFANVATFDVPAPSTSLVVESVPPGYYVARVRAYNRTGPGAPSAPVSVLMTSAGRCLELTGAPALREPVVSGSYVTLSWSTPISGGSVDGYVIGAGYAPGRLNAAILRTDSDATSLTVRANDGLYFVRVAGSNPCGVGEPSNETSVTVGPAIPGPPTALVAAVVSGGVTLSWIGPSAGAPLTGYIVEAGSAPGLSDIAVLDAGTSTTFFTVAAPRVYHVRVRALNGAGASAPSNEVVVVVP